MNLISFFKKKKENLSPLELLTFSVEKYVANTYPGLKWEYTMEDVGISLANKEDICIKVFGKQTTYYHKLIINEHFNVTGFTTFSPYDEKISKLSDSLYKLSSSTDKFISVIFPSLNWKFECDNLGALILTRQNIPVLISSSEHEYHYLLIYNENYEITGLVDKINNTPEPENNLDEADEFLSNNINLIYEKEVQAKENKKDTYILNNDKLPNKIPKQTICNLLKLKYGYTTAEVVDEGLLLEVQE